MGVRVKVSLVSQVDLSRSQVPNKSNGPCSLVKQVLCGHAPSRTVGTIEMARAVTDCDTGPLNMVFQFDHMSLDQLPGQSKWALKPLDLRDLKHSLSQWQQALSGKGWNSLYFNNHDQPRAVSRFGCDLEFRVESAKMLATCLHGMQGTPYVYQGEEIGMTNYPFSRIDECQDIESLNMYREAVEQRGESPSDVMRSVRAKGRDNARTPMQWISDLNSGFSRGAPWLTVNPNFTQINADLALADADSVFHHYRKLISLRRELPLLVHGSYELLLPHHPTVYAYRRALGTDQLLVVCNFSAEPAEVEVDGWSLERAQMLLANWPMPNAAESSAPGSTLRLRPYEALMLHLTQQ